MSLPTEIADLANMLTHFALLAQKRGQRAEMHRYTQLTIQLAKVVGLLEPKPLPTGYYRTAAGRKFTLGYDGPSPLQLFDEQRWAECAHACAYLISLRGDPELALRSLQDDALIHELLHLACGIEICTHNGRGNVRSMVADITPVHLQAA